MRKRLWICLVIIMASFLGLFASQSKDEERIYRKSEYRYAEQMPTEDIVKEICATISEIEQNKNDMEKTIELYERVMFYNSILEFRGENISNYWVD